MTHHLYVLSLERAPVDVARPLEPVVVVDVGRQREVLAETLVATVALEGLLQRGHLASALLLVKVLLLRLLCLVEGFGVFVGAAVVPELALDVVDEGVQGGETGSRVTGDKKRQS